MFASRIVMSAGQAADVGDVLVVSAVGSERVPVLIGRRLYLRR